MRILSDLFKPLTAHPFLRNKTYTEIKPCDALRPYVRCFWGAQDLDAGFSSAAGPSLVIPDACMDIIFCAHKDSPELTSFFVGISDESFFSMPRGDEFIVFAIRFYFWAVPLFASESMKGCLNGHFDVDMFFKTLGKELRDRLCGYTTLSEKVRIAERLMLRKLDISRHNHNVLNAVYRLLQTNGTTPVSDLCTYTAVGRRQLERLFTEYVGASPKTLARLVRYQYLWRDIALSNADIQDAVLRFSYTDQAHLLHDFKKHHRMTPSQARLLALGSR